MSVGAYISRALAPAEIVRHHFAALHTFVNQVLITFISDRVKMQWFYESLFGSFLIRYSVAFIVFF